MSFYQHCSIYSQIICELDPLFVAEHYDELQERWILQDGYGSSHQVQFNKCMLMPMLMDLHEFKIFYHITSNPLMSYTYLGNSTFQIKIFNVSTPINEYPRYHRLTTSNLKDLTFQVDMPDKDPISSKLVNILYFIILLKSFFVTSFCKLNMTYYFSLISDSTK